MTQIDKKILLAINDEIQNKYPSWGLRESEIYWFLEALSRREVTLWELRNLWTPKGKWTKYSIMEAINPIVNKHGYNIVSKGKGVSQTIFSLVKI